eukprot:TRINITY_DN9878_c0_g2_i1.p1 TRINITY_DN9878_c0_g2~~TRINITY_DN9878_c0_g2_i1.p1  ORF type:complete len:195 (-),score=51.87 TRINITY_DN9878_c0_g2_i1:162-746(-)
MQSKKILLVCANPKPKSFCHAIVETAVQTFKEKGYETVVRDLYAMKFDPVLHNEELTVWGTDALPKDVVEEQKHINWCDLIVLVYPMWWYGMPAILKGYFERVFNEKFAYTEADGLLKGVLNKEVLIFLPQGGPESATKEKIWPAMNEIVNTSLVMCGLKVLGCHYFTSMSIAPREVFEGYLKQVKEICSKLCF